MAGRLAQSALHRRRSSAKAQHRQLGIVRMRPVGQRRPRRREGVQPSHHPPRPHPEGAGRSASRPTDRVPRAEAHRARREERSACRPGTKARGMRRRGISVNVARRGLPQGVGASLRCWRTGGAEAETGQDRHPARRERQHQSCASLRGLRRSRENRPARGRQRRRRLARCSRGRPGRTSFTPGDSTCAGSPSPCRARDSIRGRPLTSSCHQQHGLLPAGWERR